MMDSLNVCDNNLQNFVDENLVQPIKKMYGAELAKCS